MGIRQILLLLHDYQVQSLRVKNAAGIAILLLELSNLILTCHCLLLLQILLIVGYLLGVGEVKGSGFVLLKLEFYLLIFEIAEFFVHAFFFAEECFSGLENLDTFL